MWLTRVDQLQEPVAHPYTAGKDYDLIFDTVGKAEDWSVGAPKVLKKGGEFVSVANFGDAATTDACVFKNFLLKSDAADLTVLMARAVRGHLAHTFSQADTRTHTLYEQTV